MEKQKPKHNKIPSRCDCDLTDLFFFLLEHSVFCPFWTLNWTEAFIICSSILNFPLDMLYMLIGCIASHRWLSIDEFAQCSVCTLFLVPVSLLIRYVWFVRSFSALSWWFFFISVTFFFPPHSSSVSRSWLPASSLSFVFHFIHCIVSYQELHQYTIQLKCIVSISLSVLLLSIFTTVKFM